MWWHQITTGSSSLLEIIHNDSLTGQIICCHARGPRTVLTSAHCLLPLIETYVIAGLKSFARNLPIKPSFESEGQIQKVTKIKLHEKFRTESEYDFDIAIASFDEELSYGGNVASIKLTSYWARLDDSVFTFGWQFTPPGNQSWNLMSSTTRMVCRSKGLKDLAQPEALDNLNISTDGVLFVKDQIPNNSLCYGYAGSPLMVKDSQIGIASFGIDSDCQGLNAASSIRRHLWWIEKNKALLEGRTDTKIQDGVVRGSSTRRIKKETLGANEVLRNRKPFSMDSEQSRIRNGTRLVSPDTFPFLVGVADYVSDDSVLYKLPHCTGSILSKKHRGKIIFQYIVLTAAHCIGDNMIVYAEIVDLSKTTEEEANYQAVRVLSYRMHEKFNIAKGYDYDIGLLLLSSPLKINLNVTPLCQLGLDVPLIGTSLSLAGWGFREDGIHPSFPSWGNITVRASPPWYDSPGAFVLDTATTGPSACPGDSGGPYFNSDHEVVGVHKTIFGDYGPGRRYNKASNGTSTGWVFEWIIKKMEELEDEVQ